MTILNKEAMMPLHSCIFSDNVKSFTYFLEVTDKQKHIEYRGNLVEKTIDIKAYKGLTPIMIAIEEDSFHIFEYLLDQGAELKAQDDEGNTALHRAILLKD